MKVDYLWYVLIKCDSIEVFEPRSQQDSSSVALCAFPVFGFICHYFCNNSNRAIWNHRPASRKANNDLFSVPFLGDLHCSLTLSQLFTIFSCQTGSSLHGGFFQINFKIRFFSSFLSLGVQKVLEIWILK